MISRFHYSRSVYQQFLNDELAVPTEREMQRHVESCVECQDTLERMLDEDGSWAEVPQLLRGTPGSHAPADRVQSDTPPDFLAVSDRPGSLGRFGRYEIVELLGRGGMGLVMKGFDPALNRYSAIKVLAPVLATSSSARQRFAREAKSAAAVVHEHVVPIQTVDEVSGLPYFVMPVINGQSLQQRVEEHGPLETKEVLRIGLQIASGLSAAHAQGLVHRDVKPANVLLENGVERVRLTDFGLARAADDAHMTQSGVISGTPQYMSPEQARGTEVDHRSDLFSLGSVLYFMCTGHSPFRAETTVGVLHRIANDDPRSIRQINPDVPEWLQNIICHLLMKDKDDRIQSAAEVADLLSSWLAHLQRPDAALRPAAPRAIASTLARGQNGYISRKLIAIGGGMLALFFGVLVILEMNKGTLTIECAEDDVPVLIMKGDKVDRKLTVDRGATSTRVIAGEYVVEIDGGSDHLEVKQGEIVLTRGGAAVAKIVQSPAPAANELGDRNAEASLLEFDKRIDDADGKKMKVADARDLQGPMRVEFLEGTDIFVLRGRGKDVNRAMAIINRISNEAVRPSEEDEDLPHASGPGDGDQSRDIKPRSSKGTITKERPDTSLLPIPSNAIVFIEADWCLTCATLGPTIDELIEEGYPIVRLDVTDSPALVQKVTSRKSPSIPSLVAYRGGKEVDYVDAPGGQAEVREFVKSHLRRSEGSTNQPITKQKLPDAASAPAIPGNAVVFFELESCSSCQQMVPVIESLIEEGYPVVRLDVGRFPEVAERFRINTTPSLTILRGGKEVAHMVGRFPAQNVRRFVEAEMPLGDQTRMTEGSSPITLEVTGAPFSDVLMLLGKTADVQFEIDHDSLAAEGIELPKVVDASFKGTPVDAALRAFLSPHGLTLGKRTGRRYFITVSGVPE